MPTHRPPDTGPGQAIYNRFTLRVYDGFVLGLSNRWIWRCPTTRLAAHYRVHASANHLDVGVGSGYFPARTTFDPDARLVLMDLNETALAYAARRLADRSPQTVVADVMRPVEFQGPRFDSISLFYLLHCLPGTLIDKAVVLDHLTPLLESRGTLFGATLLADAAHQNRSAAALMRLYNHRGIFSNRADDEHSLHAILHARFTEYHIERVGGVALFSARYPRELRTATSRR